MISVFGVITVNYSIVSRTQLPIDMHWTPIGLHRVPTSKVDTHFYATNVPDGGDLDPTLI